MDVLFFYNFFVEIINTTYELSNNSAIIYFNTRSTLSLRLSKNFHELTINYVLEWT